MAKLSAVDLWVRGCLLGEGGALEVLDRPDLLGHGAPVLLLAYRVWVFGFEILWFCGSGFGFGFWGFGVWVFGLRGVGFGVQGLGLRVEGLWFGVWGFGVQSAGLRVSD